MEKLVGKLMDKIIGIRGDGIRCRLYRDNG
jgi:hypothetical protein